MRCNPNFNSPALSFVALADGLDGVGAREEKYKKVFKKREGLLDTVLTRYYVGMPLSPTNDLLNVKAYCQKMLDLEKLLLQPVIP